MCVRDKLRHLRYSTSAARAYVCEVCTLRGGWERVLRGSGMCAAESGCGGLRVERCDSM